MKKLLTAMSIVATLVVSANVHFDYHETEQSTDLIPTNAPAALSMMLGEDSAALMHALRLQMAKYDLDMRSASGRRSWHGRLVGEEIHTNELTKVEVYSNEVTGAVWRFKTTFKPKPMVTATTQKTTFSTNGIPARLAAARAKRAAEIDSGTIITNVIINANK